MPRNPRYFDTMEGRRSSVSDIFIDRNSVPCTYVEEHNHCFGVKTLSGTLGPAFHVKPGSGARPVNPAPASPPPDSPSELPEEGRGTKRKEDKKSKKEKKEKRGTTTSDFAADLAPATGFEPTVRT